MIFLQAAIIRMWSTETTLALEGYFETRLKLQDFLGAFYGTIQTGSITEENKYADRKTSRRRLPLHSVDSKLSTRS